jgi:lysophospholipase L1-like esterase
MQTIIDHVKAAGRTPVIARIPYAIGNHDNLPAYNQVVDELTAQNGLPVGPDLYTWFLNHQDEILSDNLHPNDVGRQSINRLWAQAMDSLHQP